MTGGGTVPVSGWVVGATVGLAIVAGTALWLHRRRTDAPRRAAARSVLGVGIIPWLALTLVVTLTPDPVSYARRIVVMAPTDFGQGAHRSPPAHARPHPDRAELFALRPLRHPRSGSMERCGVPSPSSWSRRRSPWDRGDAVLTGSGTDYQCRRRPGEHVGSPPRVGGCGRLRSSVAVPFVALTRACGRNATPSWQRRAHCFYGAGAIRGPGPAVAARGAGAPAVARRPRRAHRTDWPRGDLFLPVNLGIALVRPPEPASARELGHRRSARSPVV
jgi:hypothetical protein